MTGHALTGSHAGDDARTSPYDWVTRFGQVRDATTRLAAPLSPEDCALQSMADASPVKWHLGHTTWFFETFVLERFEPRFAPFAVPFRMLFNSYYNAVGPKHPRLERGLLSRPSLDEVRAYRTSVDERMQHLLGGVPCAPELAALVELGLNHEQQHQELMLTDVKHLLSRNPLAPAYQPAPPRMVGQVHVANWHAHAGGIVWTGAAGNAFAFDNERPRHRVFLEPFELASRPVTNVEFMRFIADDGYRRPELWLSLGWDTVQERGWHAPLYWTQEDGAWSTFTLHGRVPIDEHAPVTHVSFFEADAYARWAGARLPTEHEWETFACDAPVVGNFADSRAFEPLPAPRTGAQDRPLQLFGDVWEWTRSEYGPYPGFQVADGAVGEYNGKFMCSQYVLRGGSCATPRSHVRATYRNFFPPETRWQLSGIRLAK